MNIESIWGDATKTVIPREGDFVCVSHRNIKEFARMLIEEHIENIAKVWYEQGLDIRGGDISKFMKSLDKHFNS